MSQPLSDVSSALKGRYAIERELGHGGMATVYLAHDLRHERRVALKVLSVELGAALGPERFQREIRLAGRLSHPHILPILDSGEGAGSLWYAMPYVDGESLRWRLEREPQLAVADAVRIASQVAGALDYAHRQGIIHRDIKPENILLAGDQALVADFGIAKALEPSDGGKLTETGLSLGTPAYMSPEQGTGGAIDVRSDVYALGCVLYEMLAGSPPFTGGTAQAILARHAVDPVPRLRTVRPVAPEAIERAVERALAKVPADRFPTAARFAEALVAGQDSAAWRIQPRRIAVAAVVGVTAVIVGIGALTLRGSEAAPVPPSATAIAVLPFFPARTDTALTRLGRDLAVTVGASLDGVGGIRTADRLLVGNETAKRSSLAPGEAAAIARRLGATSFVRGTLAGASLSVSLDLGLYRTEDLGVLASGISITAHRDSIRSLSDSLSWALLRQIWRRGEPPSPSLAAVTTRSLPALRAFLDGERHSGANRWDEAVLAYRGAIAADSTFWLAHFRYAMAKLWSHHEVEPEILEALRAHRDVFPERDRLLVAALLDSLPLTERADRLQVIAQRHRDYWPAWLHFGDMLFHNGPLIGRDWTEGLASLRRAVALNPGLVPAWEHISALVYERDPVEDSIVMAKLAELGYPGADGPVLRFENGVARAGGAIPPHLSRLADSLVSLMESTPNPPYISCRSELDWPWGWRCHEQVRRGYPVAQVQLNTRALNRRRLPPQMVPAFRVTTAWAWAARGQWDSALTILAEVAAEHPGVIGQPRYDRPFYVPIGGPVLAIESYGLAVLGAWLGTAAPSVAEERRAAAAAGITALSDEASRRDAWGRLAWLDGLLGFARGDRRAIGVAREDARRSEFFQAQQVDRSLAAYDLALAGDRRRAGRDLAALEEWCADYDEYCNHFTPSIAVQRLLAAQWLVQSGDAERARRLLRWQDAMVWPGWLYGFNDVLGPLTYLARARLEEAAGNARRAREYYGRFHRSYDQPMPSQRHLREEATAALARLGTDK